MSDDDLSALGGPPVDGRDRDQLRAAVRSRAPYYTGETWNPDAGGPGATLVELFSDLAAGVTERLDQVPAKHRRAFFAALGFERGPPQSADLPLTVQVSDGAGGNVAVPGGTRAVGEDATGGEVFFEVDDGFEATPAPLDRVLTVDPATDHVRRHDLSPGSDGDATLFGGANDQSHVLTLGDAGVLAVDGESDAAGDAVLVVKLETDAPPALLDALEWQYYGTHPDAGDEEDWHTLPGRDEVSGEGSDRRLDVGAVADLLDEYGYELALDAYGCPDPTDGEVSPACAAVVEQWLLGSVLARDRDREAGTPPPYVDESRDPDLSDLYEALATLARDQLDPPDADRTADLRPVTLAFELPGTVTEYETLGAESRWIRARLPAGVPQPLTERLLGVRLADVRLATGRRSSVGGESRPIAADAMLANDVPLDVPPPDPASASGDTAVRPFGTRPGRLDAFYVASEEAFTKTGQRVTLTATLSQPGSGDEVSPSVSWEYWNGSGWDRLPLEDPAVGDGTAADATADAQFRKTSSTVSFEVPSDLAPTEVAGHEGHWIRVRLVGGDYGQVKYEQPSDTEEVWQRIDEVTEPVVTALGLTYESPTGELAFETPAHAKRENNLAVSDVDPTGQFHPFEGVPADEQTLYLGFDGPLRGGPLQAYLSLADFRYPPEFAPRVRWESWQGDGWAPVSVRDGTEGLRETGVVRFSPPAETAPMTAFGADRHWLRARVTAPGGFVPEPYRRVPGRERDSEGGTGGAGDDSHGTSCGCCGGVSRLCDPERPRQRCGDRLPTTPPGAGTVMALPRSDLLVENTAIASNVRTVTDEILGSGDGTADQTFAVASPPARDPTVWVDELATLSAGARESLAADPAVTVEAVGPEGDLDAFWVAWERVEDFRSSGPEDRHYTVDSVAGTVTFGDGTRGAVPPRGRDNVRASYKTGGGANGNVPAGAVGGLEGTLAFVDSVTNHVPAGGGADAESSVAVLERAPKELRDRNRAVAPVDFERIALASARKLARARCLPQLDPRGEVRPGWVTVLVVPQSAERKPVPSPTLRERVTRGLAAHAPAALLAEEGEERLVVRAPSYVEATVEATVAAEQVDSQSALEAAAADAVASFLHPLTGGDDATGWPFGDLPCVSDCLAVLERVEGVDHVEDLRLRFRADGTEQTVRPGESVPDVAADVLVHSGTHRIDAVGGI